MGVPSKMHPRDKVRAHLPASQRKEGLGECHLGSTDPWGRLNPDGLPSKCILARSNTYSTSSRGAYASILVLAGNQPP